LIWEIKRLELELGIQLQVVHVPGVVMVQQGSDGLSRGVWVTPFQAITDQRTLTAAVYRTTYPRFPSHRVLHQSVPPALYLPHSALVRAVGCKHSIGYFLSVVPTP
jgi:hypothetical protein